MKSNDSRTGEVESGNQVDARAENIEPPSWIPELEQFVSAVLHTLNISGREVSVLLTDDNTMQDLNHRFRGLDEPTDVLSFGDEPPGDEGPLGDIVIDVPLVTRQAHEYATTPEEELRRVTIHGILHLTGHTHSSNDFTDEPMLNLQEKILASIKERLF